MLPDSHIVVDRPTIERHLLSSATDPFSRAPLQGEQAERASASARTHLSAQTTSYTPPSPPPSLLTLQSRSCCPSPSCARGWRRGWPARARATRRQAAAAARAAVGRGERALRPHLVL